MNGLNSQTHALNTDHSLFNYSSSPKTTKHQLGQNHGEDTPTH